ncbi:hypothetical protein JHK82_055213 [Glycine max]|nr:hypothetical protein JHK86_055055 [Glycine max]KAG4917745.1 hypothetical protein JHK85_056026 [Glycine max]KAG5073843.1 hypothetical protein JHK84_055074 [Glycine max]KAG5076518.1 hypothetical protein JHK82_055213 [Glycine max]
MVDIILYERPRPKSVNNKTMEGLVFDKDWEDITKETVDIMLYERPSPKSIDKKTMGYVVVIAIPKEEYREGLEDCKSYLHSRILLAKGVPPPRVSDLQAKDLASFGTLAYGPNWKRLLQFFFLLSSRFT